jgi:hypothetical protein
MYIMKKKIFGSITILAIAVVTMFNMSLGSKISELSPVSLANVEALAQSESNKCPGYECSYTDNFGTCTACCPGKAVCNSFGCSCS